MNEDNDRHREPEPPEGSDLLESLLGRYIERSEEDDPDALEELCAEHPELAEALREEVAKLSRYWKGLEDLGTMDDSDRSLVGKVLGRFEILEEIGRGGMGVVCLAQDPNLKRRVALKILLGYRMAGPKEVERFHREILAVAKLKHRAIIPVYEVGEVDGAPFFAMEYVEGRTLDRSLSSFRASKGHIEKVCRLVRDIALALHHAHENGIIHRDVKPSNILLAEDGKAFLFDFGLALISSEPALTQTGDFLGTPYYVSPEQVKGRSETLDRRTDVYSLGVTLYELLTFERPFTGESSQQIFRKILSREPISLRRKNDAVPRDLETICLTAMEKDPGRRYETAGEMAEDLLRFLEYRPVRARPVGRLTRVSRFVRRHRVLVGSFGSVLIALMVGLVVSLSALERAKREWRRAEREKLAADEARGEVTNQKLKVETALRELGMESRRAVKIKDSLEWMLQSVDPDRFGRGARYLEVVRSTAESLSARFEGDPRIDASLRLTLATSLRRLGAFEESEEQLEVARDLEERGHLRPEESLRVRSEEGRLRRDQGRWKEAVAIQEGAVASARETFGASSILRDCLGDLARALHDDGRWVDAEAVFREAIGLCRPDDEQIDGLRLDLAHVFQDQFKLGEARDIVEGVWQRRRSTLGEDHFDTLRAEHQLGFLHRSLGDFSEAEARLRRSRLGYRRLLGPSHPLTLRATRTLVEVSIDRANYSEARTILEEALGSIASLQDNEWLSLDVRSTQAHLLYRLGHLKEAAEIQRDAVELLVERLGASHPKSLEAERQLGDFLIELGHLQEAEGLFRKTFDSAKSQLGEDHPITLGIGSALGVAIGQGGEWQEAERLQGELLAQAESRFGLLNRVTLDILGMRVDLLRNLGRLEECEALSQKILDFQKERFGPESNHPSILRAINRHALVVANQGRFLEGVRLFEEVVKRARASMGPDHPHLATYLMNQGFWYFFSNRDRDAESAFREVVRIRKKSLGPEHFETLAARRELAHSLFSIGGKENLDEAFSLLDGVLESVEEKLGVDHPHVLRTLYVTARCLVGRGQFSEAEPIFLDVVRRGEELFGESHQIPIEARSALARCYQRQGRYAEAEPIHRRNLIDQTARFGPEYTATVITMNNLAHLLAHTDRYEEALKLNEKILEIWTRQMGEKSIGVLATYNNLTDLYLKTGDLENAGRVSARLVEVAEGFMSRHWRMGVFRTSYGRYLTAAGEFEKAESQLQSAEALLTKELGARAKETREAKQALEALQEARNGE